MYLIQGKVGIQNSDSDTQGGSCQLNIAGSMADLDRSNFRQRRSRLPRSPTRSFRCLRPRT